MELQKRKEILDSLNGRLKGKKYFALLLALFTFGVNIFAWFVFSSSVDLELDASVASWNVTFKDGNDIISKNVIINVNNMKPGMDTFSKTYSVRNDSGTPASFSYDITAIELLGEKVDLSDVTDPVSYFNNIFPFDLRFSKTKEHLGDKDSSEFTLDVMWDFEDNNKYFQQSILYGYNPTLNYYRKSGNTYTIDTSINNATSFLSNKNNLYLDKDDADSYFGMLCSDYERNYGKSCLKVSIVLNVEQINE